MNKLLKSVLALVCTYIIVACAPVSVKTDYDTTINFASYKTYNWDPEMPTEKAPPGQVTSLLETLVKNRVEKELGSKGLSKNESKPDVLLAWKAHTEQVRDVVVESQPYYGRYGYRSGNISVDTYKVGMLELVMIDPVKKQIIWRGAAESVVGSGNASEKLDKAVTRMFKYYPPSSK